MKVALDVSAVPPQLAGAGRYIAELARRLPSAGVETTLVTRRDDTLRWHEWSPTSSVASIVPNARATRLAYEAWLLGRSAPAMAVDVWHAPHYTMPHRRSTPTVVTIHDLTFFTNPEWHERSKVQLFRRAITYAAAHADVLVSVSDYTARQIDQLLPSHAPVVVAPLGVDLARFTTDASHDAELLQAHGLDVGVPYIFFLGTVEPRKGLDVLIAAFADVARTDPDVELWLAGQVGWRAKALESTLASHSVAARIRRLGFVDDTILPALLRQSRTVAYPSRGEGFGLPVLEALACGAFVVTSSDTVMAEVAADTATLTHAGDASQLANALLTTIAMSDEKRSRHRVTARARAEMFTWEASIAQHLCAYQMAVAT